MSFSSPARLWLLLGVAMLVTAYLAVQASRTRYTVRFTNLSLLETVAPKQPGWRRHVAAAFFLLMVTSLTLAFARPVMATREPRELATILLALDTSVSMHAKDIHPSRLDAAEQAARTFVEDLPGEINLSLVTFSGFPKVQVQPTRDHDLVLGVLDGSLRLGQGTAIGEAIFASLDVLEPVIAESASESVPARIVLLSDGETTVGRPDHIAAEAAAELGIPVSTIAFGTGQASVAVRGQPLPVPVNKEALRTIAEVTGGSFYEATSANQLNQVYEDLGSQIATREEQRDVTPWFIGLALLFATAAAAGSLLWFSRLP